MSDSKKTIQVYWDPIGVRQGRIGCYRARLRENHGIHDAGGTRKEAITNFLITAKSLGKSGDKQDYTVAYL